MKTLTLKNVKKLMICCCIFCGLTTVNAQELKWAKNLAGTGYDAARTVAVDAAGNTYVAGVFSDVTDFDPGTGVQSLTSMGWDIFLLKLDTAGAFVWVKHFVPSNADIMAEPSCITLDTAGNIYMTGNFGSYGTAGTLDFDPGTAVYNLSPTGSFYTTDIFVLKLNASGGFEWAKQFGGNKIDQSSGIVVDNSGNVFTTGFFRNTADFNPGTGVDNLTSSSAYGDMFISKLDNDGNFVWAKKIGAIETIRSKSIKADADGNLYTMGTFSGTVDFDPGTGVQNRTTSAGPYGWSNANIFVGKYDNDGNYIWVKNMGIPNNIYSGDVSPMAMSVDLSGNIYTVGAFTDTADFDPGSSTANLVSFLTGVSDADIFISKLNNNGDFVWAKSMGGTAGEMASNVTTDKYGNVFTIGTFGGPVDFNPSDTGEFLMTPFSQAGALFISKLDSSGNFAWAKSIGGPQCGLGMNGLGVAINPLDDGIHIASEFTCTIDFDPGPDTFNLTAASNNVFVVKLTNCNLRSSTLNITSCDSFNLNGTVYSQSGTYSQTHAMANGCDSIVTLELVIHHKPGAGVTRTGNILSANTAGGATYQWVDCNNNSTIAGATQQTYTATTNGRYAVIVTKDECSATSACYEINTTGINEKEVKNDFQVYPNPTSGMLTVNTSKMLRNATVKLMNVIGQTIYQTKESGNLFQINMAELAAQVYILEIEAEGEISRTRIVKQ